ncbi:carbonyl reductase [NADPH] 1-like [Zerene cesonia]|uniref:carbonyl reductase [NADPH] 1-like n=1 Tax=Zerene cesonia TaxID=33412 RepID=UPI0018E58C3F|nr:carbonyl reductase [NADPH] 1-like [Zerene cesonia]
MLDKVAIVTGANKGIGFSIVKELCRRGVKTVYLTARDVKRGTDAVNSLKNEGFNPLFHQLEVTDKKSVQAFADHIKQNHKGIDILINNAAVISEFNKITYEDAHNVINVNFNSILIIEEYLFPLLNDNARVINVSSDCGHLSNLKNAFWIEKLISEDATLDDVKGFTNWFLDNVKNGTFNADDFTITYLRPYVVSKIALSAYTRIQQRNIGRGICINSIHPGFVITSMTKETGMMTAAEASEAPVYLALDADEKIKGKYIWFDKTEKDWTDINFKYTYDDPNVVNDFFKKMSD